MKEHLKAKLYDGMSRERRREIERDMGLPVKAEAVEQTEESGGDEPQETPEEE